jgi:hypothetical protein
VIYKGITHAHTNYSFDSQLTLQDYVDFGLKNNISFVLFAEHFDTFSPKIFEQYKEKCQQLSSDKMLLIPGIEYSLEDRIHISGFGIDKYVPANKVEDIIQIIEQSNGLSSYMHPVYQNFRYDDRLAKCDAIEIQNSKYDGTFSARYKSYNLLKELRKKNSNLAVTCGTDFHKIEDFKSYASMFIDMESLDKTRILKKIKEKQCSIGNSLVRYNIEDYNRRDRVLSWVFEYTYLPIRTEIRIIGSKLRRLLGEVKKGNYQFIVEKIKNILL